MPDVEVRFIANTESVDDFEKQLQSRPISVPVVLTPSGTPTIPASPGAFSAGVPVPGAALTNMPGGGISGISQAITTQAALSHTAYVPRPVPYELASTLPEWAARRERENFDDRPDVDLGDVEALGQSAEEAVAPSGGRRGGGRAWWKPRGRGGAYVGVHLLRTTLSYATGYEKAYQRLGDIGWEAKHGFDPGMDRLRAAVEEQQVYESMPGGSEATAILNLFGAASSPTAFRRQAQHGIRELEGVRRGIAASAARASARRGTALEIAGLYGEADVSGATGTERERRQVQASFAQQIGQISNQRAALGDAITAAPAGSPERQAAEGRLRDFDKTRGALEAATLGAATARLNDVRRQDRLGSLLASNQYDALALGAAGRFGAAKDASFEAGLRAAEIQATIAPQYAGQLGDVQSLNAIRRKQDEARTAYEGRQVSYDSAATQAELRHDPLGAIDARYAGRAADILANADPANAAALTKQAGRERALARQSFEEQTREQLYGLNVANAGLSEFVSGAGTPGERRTTAEGIDIYGATLEASRNALLAGRGGNLDAIRRHGQLQLEQLSTSVLAGFKAQEVNLGHVAVTSPEEGLSKIQELLESLKSMPDKLDAINKTLQDFDKVQ